MPLLYLALTVVLGVGFVWLLFTTARRGGPAADPATGALTFRHAAPLRWFAVFALFGAELLFAVFAVLYPDQAARMAVPLVLGAATLGLAGVLLCWEAYRYAVTVTDAELDCRSPWRGRRVAPWEAITRVEFSAATAWFVLRFADGGSFRVPAVVAGIGQFLAACERHLKPEQLRPAKGGYPLAGRAWPFPKEG
jgi:hypothetical protein